ncbi:uncharacterized protein LOC113514531 [Galleria mellonella]|uniref:Uncharacterized protein LOC113514531 n=1 Tax=Galleria mellonella TaxID=7137 RepID=A0A6J1WQN9_GALME|nr:uncharacterized protein LOC113514531 [Galleria mellonella]
MTILSKVLSLPVHFPLVRGMVSYAIIWPTCSIVQEYIAHGTTIENADFARAARFGVFGTIFWPTVQTINFYFVLEKNRIVFVSAASFVWTVYLAHVKAIERKKEAEVLDEKKI